MSEEIEKLSIVLIHHQAVVWSLGDVECSCSSWRRRREGEDWERETHEVRSQFIQEHCVHVAEEIVKAREGS